MQSGGGSPGPSLGRTIPGGRTFRSVIRTAKSLYHTFYRTAGPEPDLGAPPLTTYGLRVVLPLGRGGAVTGRNLTNWGGG